MAAAKLGDFRCDTEKIRITWIEEQWDDGEACVEKCENLARQHGSRCCEARPRADFTETYCVFGEGLIQGLQNSKAVLCTKLPAGTKF